MDIKREHGSTCCLLSLLSLKVSILDPILLRLGLSFVSQPAANVSHNLSLYIFVSRSLALSYELCFIIRPNIIRPPRDSKEMDRGKFQVSIVTPFPTLVH